MKRFLKLLAVAIVLLLGAGLAIKFAGGPVYVLGSWLGPGHEWEAARNVPPPDYAQSDSWAARPGKNSVALYIPSGKTAPSEGHPVDVFFVHPTGYLSGAEWNSQLERHSRTEENTRWMMANQASAFSSCCDIYAPRYREASIFRYMAASEETVQQSMDLAYGDVERAFDHYLQYDNQGRPFVIASHSQGSEHAFRLVSQRIDGTPLAQQMVAAYIIGSRALTNTYAATLARTEVCDSADQTGCLVHWATYGPGGTPDPESKDELVCVNPLTWTRDGAHAAATAHLGAVPESGQFSAKIWGDDSPQGAVFGPLKNPLATHTWAQCRQGQLIVADQSETSLNRLIMRNGDNYHGLDYPLFHMNIRANVAQRIAAMPDLSPNVHADDDPAHTGTSE